MENKNKINVSPFAIRCHKCGIIFKFIENIIFPCIIMSEEKSQCHEAAKALALCIEEGPCVKERGLSVVDCIKTKDTSGCEKYVTGYFGCRKMMLDMRSRIRGNRYAEVNKEK